MSGGWGALQLLRHRGVCVCVYAFMPGCGRRLKCSTAFAAEMLVSTGAACCPCPCRTYRLSQNIKPLIWVECQVDKHSRSRTEYLVKARSQFKERSTATSVEIMLPLPPDAISPTVRTSQVGQKAGGVHSAAGMAGRV